MWDSVVIADEHGGYNDPVGLNKVKRVNHSKAYQAEDGTNTNQVESFFSRVQRAYVGIHHSFSLRYFDWNVAELALREDTRDGATGNRRSHCCAWRWPSPRHAISAAIGRGTSRQI
jgi:hypothetical protein